MYFIFCQKKKTHFDGQHLAYERDFTWVPIQYITSSARPWSNSLHKSRGSGVPPICCLHNYLSTQTFCTRDVLQIFASFRNTSPPRPSFPLLSFSLSVSLFFFFLSPLSFPPLLFFSNLPLDFFFSRRQFYRLNCGQTPNRGRGTVPIHGHMQTVPNYNIFPYKKYKN